MADNRQPQPQQTPTGVHPGLDKVRDRQGTEQTNQPGNTVQPVSTQNGPTAQPGNQEGTNTSDK
jgi:hypothetical protein